MIARCLGASNLFLCCSLGMEIMKKKIKEQKTGHSFKEAKETVQSVKASGLGMNAIVTVIHRDVWKKTLTRNIFARLKNFVV